MTISAQTVTGKPSFLKVPEPVPARTIHHAHPIREGRQKGSAGTHGNCHIMARAETPKVDAVARPIGIMASAEDVFKTNWEITIVTTKILASTTCGPAPPSISTGVGIAVVADYGVERCCLSRVIFSGDHSRTSVSSIHASM